MVMIANTFIAADDKNQKFMVFEGLSDEDGGLDIESDEPVEALEDTGISNR
jgi:hypothetical protein